MATQARKVGSPAKSTASGGGYRTTQVGIKKSEQPPAGTMSYKSESNRSGLWGLSVYIPL